MLTTSVIAAALVVGALAANAATTEVQLESKAQVGDVDAMLELAFLHYLTIDTDGENSEAIKWYQRAADAGSVEAMMQLSRIYGFELKTLPSSGIKAKEWSDRAVSVLLARVKQGDLVAETHLAYIYDLNSDSNSAMQYYRDAADKGSSEAMFEVGAHYQLGWDVQRDDKEAIFWLTKAADNNHIKAMLYLSNAYEKGEGVERSVKEAEAWRIKASAADKSKVPKTENLESKAFSWPED